MRPVEIPAVGNDTRPAIPATTDRGLFPPDADTATNTPKAARPTLLPRWSALLIAAITIALVDTIVLLWVWPIAAILAHWAGMPLLKADYFGRTAMVVSAPVILVATILAWRRMVRPRP
jgi:hypothetical protein